VKQVNATAASVAAPGAAGIAVTPDNPEVI